MDIIGKLGIDYTLKNPGNGQRRFQNVHLRISVLDKAMTYALKLSRFVIIKLNFLFIVSFICSNFSCKN